MQSQKFNIWKPEPLKKNNYVTVRIWLPLLNGQPSSSLEVIKAMTGYSALAIDETKNTRIGHISLETSKKYVSWWPGEALPNVNVDRIGALLKVVKADNSELMKDKLSEGSLGDGKIDLNTITPDVVVTLYSLNTALLEDLFDEIREEGNEAAKVLSDGAVKQSNTGYVLIGNKAATRVYNYLYNDNQQGNSCCGLAYDLLQAGGINKLTSYYSHITAQYLVLTTDNFCDFIKYAKEQELSIYPETQLFHCNLLNEYIPSVAKTSASSCTIS